MLGKKKKELGGEGKPSKRRPGCESPSPARGGELAERRQEGGTKKVRHHTKGEEAPPPPQPKEDGRVTYIDSKG